MWIEQQLIEDGFLPKQLAGPVTIHIAHVLEQLNRATCLVPTVTDGSLV